MDLIEFIIIALHCMTNIYMYISAHIWTQYVHICVGSHICIPVKYLSLHANGLTDGTNETQPWSNTSFSISAGTNGFPSLHLGVNIYPVPFAERFFSADNFS